MCYMNKHQNCKEKANKIYGGLTTEGKRSGQQASLLATALSFCVNDPAKTRLKGGRPGTDDC